MEKKLVAISTKDEKCTCLCVCKNVDDKEYKKLLNEFLESEREKSREKEKLEEFCSKIIDEIVKLKKEIKILKGED